jgi:hypothetical protein
LEEVKLEGRKIIKLRFRQIRTPSYIFGSCFAGFVIEFDNGEPENQHYLHEDMLQWRTEQVSSSEFVSYCGPEPIRLELAESKEIDPETGDIIVSKSINIFRNNYLIGTIWEFHDSFAPLCARLESAGGIAITTLYGVSADATHFWFSNDLKPKAQEQEPQFEDWDPNDPQDGQRDSGHIPF